MKYVVVLMMLSASKVNHHFCAACDTKYTRRSSSLSQKDNLKSIELYIMMILHHRICIYIVFFYSFMAYLDVEAVVGD